MAVMTEAGVQASPGRLLPPPGSGPVDLALHEARFGPTPYAGGPGRLVPLTEASGLTGRGGAAFPVGRKLAAVLSAAAASSKPAVAVANGAESEPASRKDQLLMRLSPHLVLDGLQLAAEAVGAPVAYLYLRRDEDLHRVVTAALVDRANSGADRIEVRLVDAPTRFVSGQDSAAARRIEGGPALPRYREQRPHVKGVRGAPTLVQNVETLAHLALIARYGPDWFRRAGTDAEPGTMLATVYRPDGSTQVVETSLGTPVADLLGAPVPLASVLVGGFHGGWLPAAAVSAPLSAEGLRPYGLRPGAGLIAGLPADRCGLAETAHLTRYLAGESSHQCGPCFNGLPRIADAVAELAGPAPQPAALDALERWTGLMTLRGGCRHPDETTGLVRSALRTFADEIGRHAAGICSGARHDPFLPVPGSA